MRRLLLALLVALPLAAQGPSADWRTIESAHFRVHYPREYEAWAMRVAERLESIRIVVSKEVGFTPPQTIDVLVMNPIAEPNGAAITLLDTPRILFFTEPPGPDEQLGDFGHWIDLVAVHETAHLVHMLRPSRNPFERAIEKSVLPLNPITLHAPRWVLEGYATVIEGRITGAGRPTSTMRALILRRWAENGNLPTYGQLDSDRRFLGMNMAYLLGSAYLEWLEQRTSPDALRNLWARMTARHRRSFGEAFTGVFGDSPDRLYGQFVAELTASAVAARKSDELHEGSLFQETPRASGDPAVSPDGTKIAVVIRDDDEPQKLVIWSTAAPVEEEKEYQERLEKILKRDPEDVPPVRTKPLPRDPVHELTMPDGGDIATPRWTRDGKAIVFAHRLPDAEGVLHFDLYRWDFESLTRITRLADVRDADPIDERTAIAVRSRFGASQFVNVDLTTGEVTPRTEASIDEIVSHPRVSHDGKRIAYVAHRGGRWKLYIDDTPIDLPGDPASPEWLPDDTLVVTVLGDAVAELHHDGAPITRTAGGAFQPAPSSDGRIFFMSLDPDGYVVRVLEQVANLPQSPLPAARGEAVAVQSAATGEGRPYGLGNQELSWFLSQNIGPNEKTSELGLRLGDVIGRLDTLLIASFGDLQGLALATAWRGWPVELHAHAYKTDDDDGLELRGRWSRHFPQSRLTLEAGTGDLTFATAAFNTRQVFGTLRVEEGARIELDDEHHRAILGAAIRTNSLRIAARVQRDRGAEVTLGGLPSSLLPRSAYALRVLDPALPVAILAGDEYDGWRIETTLPSLPFTAFYQRHELGAHRLSLAGVQIEFGSEPVPLIKLPGVDLTLGAARIFDTPLAGETKWWLGMRWRP